MEKNWKALIYNKLREIEERLDALEDDIPVRHMDHGLASDFAQLLEGMETIRDAAPPPPPPEGPPNTLHKEGDTSKKRKLPAKIRICIEAALRRSDSEQRTGCGVSEQAQEEMRIYLNTWVAGPLQSVIDWDDGKALLSDIDWR